MKKRVLRTLSLMIVAVMLTATIPLAAFADSSGVRSMDVCKTSAASMTLDGKVTDGEAWDLVSWSTVLHHRRHRRTGRLGGQIQIPLGCRRRQSISLLPDQCLGQHAGFHRSWMEQR